jgi:hypothetical protein
MKTTYDVEVTITPEVEGWLRKIRSVPGTHALDEVTDTQIVGTLLAAIVDQSSEEIEELVRIGTMAIGVEYGLLVRHLLAELDKVRHHAPLDRTPPPAGTRLH